MTSFNTAALQVYPAPVLIQNAGAVGAPALNQTFTDQRYPLLSRQAGNNGHVFLYVYASGSISKNALVLVAPGGSTGAGGNTTPISYANIRASTNQILTNMEPGPVQVGVTDQTAFGAATYGWITITGLCYVGFKGGIHLRKGLFAALGGVGLVTSTLSFLASSQALRSSPLVQGMQFAAGLTAKLGSGTQVGTANLGIGALGTASISGDVRPVFIAGGGAYIDKSVVVAGIAAV
jgi:hypothetical protein